jgi:hypothetical protein
MKTSLAAVVFVLGVLVSASAVAIAAPVNAKNASQITIVCPSGTYTAVVNGNGDFTAAHAVDSNTVLIPIAFGEFIGTINGVVVDDEPPLVKGNSVPGNGRIQECNYTFRAETPDGPFVGSGSVTGFIART